VTRPLRHLVLAVAAVALLAGCRLELDVSVEMEPDGTGAVTIVATADAELVDQVPGLLDDLRLDDAVAQGWQISEPVTDAEGAITLTLTHPFHTDVELANVLNSIGPPFTAMQAARTPGTAEQAGQVTNAVIGNLQLANGFESFSDSDLSALVGGLPFGEQIAASGLTPDQAIGVTFRVELPGEVVSAPTGTEIDPGVIEWRPPLDGTTTAVEYQTVQRPADEGNAWAKPLATVALIALIAWVLVSVAFIAFVAVARRSKRRKRERALRRLR
jgi:hypothetical protein